MTIKISAFPDAATPMASADRVTGLQGGANVNFSQAQLLSTPDGAAGAAGGIMNIRMGSGDAAGSGGGLYQYAGNGGATGDGGYIGLYAGSGGVTSGGGGRFLIHAGNAVASGSNGGRLELQAGAGAGIGAGGPVNITGGFAPSGHGGDININGGFTSFSGGTGNHGGDVKIYGGYAYNSGNTGGDVFIGVQPSAISSTVGNVFLKNIPNQVDATGVPSGAIWRNSATGTLNQAP